MRTLLIILFVCGSIDIHSAIISNSTMEFDATELVKLYKEFQLAEPEAVHRARDATCQITSKCCPEIKSTFMSLFFCGDTNELINQCFGQTGSKSSLDKIFKCSPLLNLMSAVINPQYIKYLNVTLYIQTYNKEDLESTIHICLSEGLSSILCDSNNDDQMKSCQRKILEQYAQQGDQIYIEKVQQSKESMRRIIDKIKKALDA